MAVRCALRVGGSGSYTLTRVCGSSRVSSPCSLVVYLILLLSSYHYWRSFDVAIPHDCGVAWCPWLDPLSEIGDGEHASTGLVWHVDPLVARSHVWSRCLAAGHVKEILIIMPLRHRNLHVALAAYYRSVKRVPELHCTMYPADGHKPIGLGACECTVLDSDVEHQAYCPYWHCIHENTVALLPGYAAVCYLFHWPKTAPVFGHYISAQRHTVSYSASLLSCFLIPFCR